MAENDEAIEHAWRYFQLHAGQRITVFNYFIVFSGLILTGLASTIQASPRLSSVGIILGLLLSFLSFVFWKLDQRTSFLIKHAEDLIKTIEPAAATLFLGEAARTEDAKKEKGLWTYGKVFRTIFLVLGLVGISGSVASGLRWSGILSWTDDAQAKVAPTTAYLLKADTLPYLRVLMAPAALPTCPFTSMAGECPCQ